MLEPVLQVDALVKHYPVRGGLLGREVGTCRPWTA